MEHQNVVTTSGMVECPDALPLNYDLHHPAEHNQPLPVVLFLHGFKGFKNWGPFPGACREVASAGFAVLAFNLSHNGVSGHGKEFDEPELFADQTLSRDLDDVGTILQQLKNGNIQPEQGTLNIDQIGIIGHSRGGHTAIAAAAEYDAFSALVTWSAVANYNKRWTREMIDDWKKKGYTEIKNARTGQIMRLNIKAWKDAKDNAGRLMADKRIPEITAPTLIIHGQEDEAVPVEDAKNLFDTCNAERKNCIIIPDTGHTFDGAHPFEGRPFPNAFEKALTYTCQWLQVYLKSTDEQ